MSYRFVSLKRQLLYSLVFFLQCLKLEHNTRRRRALWLYLVLNLLQFGIVSLTGIKGRLHLPLSFAIPLPLKMSSARRPALRITCRPSGRHFPPSTPPNGIIHIPSAPHDSRPCLLQQLAGSLRHCLKASGASTPTRRWISEKIPGKYWTSSFYEPAQFKMTSILSGSISATSASDNRVRIHPIENTFITLHTLIPLFLCFPHVFDLFRRPFLGLDDDADEVITMARLIRFFGYLIRRLHIKRDIERIKSKLDKKALLNRNVSFRSKIYVWGGKIRAWYAWHWTQASAHSRQFFETWNSVLCWFFKSLSPFWHHQLSNSLLLTSYPNPIILSSGTVFLSSHFLLSLSNLYKTPQTTLNCIHN